MEQTSALLEDIGNLKWQAYLSIFKRLTQNDPAVEEVSEQLKQLKERAKNTSELTVRQTEGIIDRCNNYLKGDYGKTKRPEHFEQSKQTSK